VPTREELLDPEKWGEVLELYGRSVNVAVALVDHQGQIIGRCHNPKPIWSLAREARPDWGSGCPFCLDAGGECTAAADAERTRAPVLTTGLGGFVHAAAPLFLGDEHLGTLLAGQVFDQYPELLPLERVAKEFGLSAQELWRLARLRVPMSRPMLTVYANLLEALGRAFLRECHNEVLQRVLAETNKKLRSSNADLKTKVAQLDQSLAEKDILLSEVHHRVNNNLAVIASLLRMQAGAFADDQVAEALRESQLRVEAMALIHAHLYNSLDWTEVDFREYVTELAANLFRSYGVDPARVTWKVDIAPLKLSVERAIPAGLILNELITNAIKHAFPNGSRGSILVRALVHDGLIELTVEDDGPGVIMETSSPRRRKSLGLKIVDILCRQLKGTFAGQSQPASGTGSIFGISFPVTSKTPKP